MLLLSLAEPNPFPHRTSTLSQNAKNAEFIFKKNKVKELVFGFELGENLTERIADVKSQTRSPFVEGIRRRRRDFPGAGFASDQNLFATREISQQEEEEEEQKGSFNRCYPSH